MLLYITVFCLFTLIVWGIIYLLFLLPYNDNKYIDYGFNFSKDKLDMVFKLYYNLWDNDKIRVKTYNDDYENYKLSLFYNYIDFYTLVQSLTPWHKNNLLMDMKSGVIRMRYIQPENKYRFYEFRETPLGIDMTIYSLFVSEKVTQEKFYELLKL